MSLLVTRGMGRGRYRGVLVFGGLGRSQQILVSNPRFVVSAIGRAFAVAGIGRAFEADAIGRMFESANDRAFEVGAIGRGFEVAARGRAFVTDTVVVQ
ncbi:MAG: hypothetical protein AB1513_08930 [Pseudomonadota bacterium]